MYYVVNQQKDTLTFYFPDGTSDFLIEKLVRLSRPNLTKLIAPFSTGDHIEDAMAFKQEFSAYEAGDLQIVSKPELMEMLKIGACEVAQERDRREDTLTMTLGLVLAGPLLFFLDMVIFESIGLNAVVSEIGAAAVVIFLFVAWIAVAWTAWGMKLEEKFEDALSHLHK